MSAASPPPPAWRPAVELTAIAAAVLLLWRTPVV